MQCMFGPWADEAYYQVHGQVKPREYNEVLTAGEVYEKLEEDK